jgi:CcmD family protein
MKAINQYFYTILCSVLLPEFLSAQQVQDTDLERNVKVWISVAVLVAILLLLFIYMFYLDNRMKKIEKETSEKETND